MKIVQNRTVFVISSVF